MTAAYPFTLSLIRANTHTHTHTQTHTNTCTLVHTIWHSLTPVLFHLSRWVNTRTLSLSNTSTHVHALHSLTPSTHTRSLSPSFFSVAWEGANFLMWKILTMKTRKGAKQGSWLNEHKNRKKSKEYFFLLRQILFSLSWRQNLRSYRLAFTTASSKKGFLVSRMVFTTDHTMLFIFETVGS